jgi:hypothetical protein
VAEQLIAAEESLRHTLSVRTRLEIALIRCSRAATMVTMDEILRQINALRQAAPPAALAAAAAAPRAPVLEDPIVRRALAMFEGSKVVEIEE